MNAYDYQKLTRVTAKTVPVSGVLADRLIYPTLGMVNEAGEFAGKVKKIFRDKGGVISEEDMHALESELGDVQWYIAQVCDALGLSLDDVMQKNIEKTHDRMRRGVIGGSGDNR